MTHDIQLLRQSVRDGIISYMFDSPAGPLMDSGIKGTFTTKEAIAAAVSHAKKVYDYLINCDEGPVLSQDMNPFGSYCEDMDDILNVMAKSELSSILNADLAYQDTIGRKTSLMGVLFPRSCR